MDLMELDAQRDGRRDFDFFYGAWKIHNRRLKAPLRGSTEWYEFEGSAQARPVWDGQANFDECVFESPLGTFFGLTIRFYDERTRLWSIYWGTAKDGLTPLPTVGAFDDAGVGNFFNREKFEGRDIICRYRWTCSSPEKCRWEQAFSLDEGATWETNWIMDFSRA